MESTGGLIMGFSNTKKEETNSALEKVVLFFDTKEMADEFQRWCKHSVERNNETERIDDYRVRACQGLEHYFRIYWNKTHANTTVESVEWHRLTEWRHAEEVYKNNRTLWNKWHKKGYIPYEVEMRVKRNEQV